MTTEPSHWTWTTDATAENERIDVFISRQDIPLSRAQVQRLIQEGTVWLDGVAVRRASHKLRAGQVVAVRYTPAPPLRATGQDIPLSVVYEDDAVVVIDKPRGMVVHPAPGHSQDTLVNALVHRFAIAVGDPLRPGLVHRLDKDTSGLMVVAKTDQAMAALTAQFHAHTISRRYAAIVCGAPPDTMRIETLHGRHPTDRKRFSSKVAKGKRAISLLRVVRRFSEAALVEVTLRTGRTHQVRVHCFDNGFPILGDPLYVPRRLSPSLRALHTRLAGQALHAGHLAFDHPCNGRRLRFDAPPPPLFQEVLRALEQGDS